MQYCFFSLFSILIAYIFRFFPIFIPFPSKTYIFYYDNAGPPYSGKMTLDLSVAYLHRFKIVVKLKINLFLVESVRDQVTVWNAKIPKKRFGGTRVSFILDLNFIKVNLLLFESYFCIMIKLINNNFFAFFEFWWLLSHEKLDKTLPCYGPFNLGKSQLVSNAILVICIFRPKLSFIHYILN